MICFFFFFITPTSDLSLPFFYHLAVQYEIPLNNIHFMTEENSDKRSLITPGPELVEKVNNFAARLSQLEKPKSDEMIARVLSSQRRNEFLFAEPSHIFYPYFLSKLTDYTLHPENRPQKAAKAEKEKAAPTAAPTATVTTTTTTTADGNVVRSGGTAIDSKREEILKQAEEEARRYQADPYPSHYALDLKDGTVDLPALATDIISLTAQYTAKYGDPFLNSVKAKQKRNPDFRFLLEDDVRHDIFKGLVESYKRILNFDEDETETRLENYSKRDYLLGVVVEEKTNYMKAALARRKAELLTDEELKAKLNWNNFKVLCTFTLSDLSLDGVVPETAASKQYLLRASHVVPSGEDMGDGGDVTAPAGMMPKFTPTFMSSSLTGKRTAAPALVPVEDDPTAAPRDNADYEVDPITGARIKKKRPREDDE
ncbi:hypothetical protein AGDE_00209 [Angomonas deanei]|uniref:Surp module, putative n=1 Tax=Angomonas deanei TaxID=59799 RepID=S9VLW5_9TRYP|nr:hypothetical protein AGDE_05637 [Angomonas deanei]EPY43712.1 hypothetical protein AGDE_00209 [Angomonas deanei]CAD2217315.1 Surp module, putative [Angomonas deanei]|eukprot:EPY38292.1 hypothetical protein AGDE_05637 [Angomonas deanei]